MIRQRCLLCGRTGEASEGIGVKHGDGRVYIVTAGDYSDYHIVAAFGKNEAAQAFAERFGGDVEVFDLDPLEQELREGWGLWRCTIKRDGEADVLSETEWRSPYPLQLRVGWETHCVLGEGIFLARDAQHAAKIANEQRAKLIASGEWDSAQRSYDERGKR